MYGCLYSRLVPVLILAGRLSRCQGSVIVKQLSSTIAAVTRARSSVRSLPRLLARMSATRGWVWGRGGLNGPALVRHADVGKGDDAPGCRRHESRIGAACIAVRQTSAAGWTVVQDQVRLDARRTVIGSKADGQHRGPV